MTISLVTTTRNRPFCFSLLERWMKAQTVAWDQWLVVNDGSEAYTYNLGQEVVLRDPSNDKLPSICCNWLEAIKHVRGKFVICIEDDDWYSPEYLSTIVAGLEAGGIAGLTHDVYYKPRERQFLRLGNRFHASLACTGFHIRPGLSDIKKVIKTYGSVWIDTHLWNDTKSMAMLFRQPASAPLHIGMKGMPGASGLGLGHGDSYSGWEEDPTGAVLRGWMGEAAAGVYLSCITTCIPIESNALRYAEALPRTQRN